MDNPFSHLDDYKLMELYKNGESMAFEVIYLRHKNRVYSYLYKRLFDKSHIEDIFQNIFIKFHKSRDLYNSKYPLVQWIYTISRSELLDAAKKKKITTVELQDEYTDITHKETEDLIDIDSVKTLSSKEKEALKLRYYSDEDFDEIAKILSTSPANSRKLVSRGLKKLKLKFQGGAK